MRKTRRTIFFGFEYNPIFEILGRLKKIFVLNDKKAANDYPLFMFPLPILTVKTLNMRLHKYFKLFDEKLIVLTSDIRRKTLGDVYDMLERDFYNKWYVEWKSEWIIAREEAMSADQETPITKNVSQATATKQEKATTEEEKELTEEEISAAEAAEKELEEKDEAMERLIKPEYWLHEWLDYIEKEYPIYEYIQDNGIWWGSGKALIIILKLQTALKTISFSSMKKKYLLYRELMNNAYSWKDLSNKINYYWTYTNKPALWMYDEEMEVLFQNKPADFPNPLPLWDHTWSLEKKINEYTRPSRMINSITTTKIFHNKRINENLYFNLFIQWANKLFYLVLYPQFVTFVIKPILFVYLTLLKYRIFFYGAYILEYLGTILQRFVTISFYNLFSITINCIWLLYLFSKPLKYYIKNLYDLTITIIIFFLEFREKKKDNFYSKNELEEEKKEFILFIKNLVYTTIIENYNNIKETLIELKLELLPKMEALLEIIKVNPLPSLLIKLNVKNIEPLLILYRIMDKIRDKGDALYENIVKRIPVYSLIIKIKLRKADIKVTTVKDIYKLIKQTITSTYAFIENTIIFLLLTIIAFVKSLNKQQIIIITEKWSKTSAIILNSNTMVYVGPKVKKVANEIHEMLLKDGKDFCKHVYILISTIIVLTIINGILTAYRYLVIGYNNRYILLPLNYKAIAKWLSIAPFKFLYGFALETFILSRKIILLLNTSLFVFIHVTKGFLITLTIFVMWIVPLDTWFKELSKFTLMHPDIPYEKYMYILDTFQSYASFSFIKGLPTLFDYIIHESFVLVVETLEGLYNFSWLPIPWTVIGIRLQSEFAKLNFEHIQKYASWENFGVYYNSTYNAIMVIDYYIISPLRDFMEIANDDLTNFFCFYQDLPFIKVPYVIIFFVLIPLLIYIYEVIYPWLLVPYFEIKSELTYYEGGNEDNIFHIIKTIGGQYDEDYSHITIDEQIQLFLMESSLYLSTAIFFIIYCYHRKMKFFRKYLDKGRHFAINFEPPIILFEEYESDEVWSLHESCTNPHILQLERLLLWGCDSGGNIPPYGILYDYPPEYYYMLKTYGREPNVFKAYRQLEKDVQNDHWNPPNIFKAVLQLRKDVYFYNIINSAVRRIAPWVLDFWYGFYREKYDRPRYNANYRLYNTKRFYPFKPVIQKRFTISPYTRFADFKGFTKFYLPNIMFPITVSGVQFNDLTKPFLALFQKALNSCQIFIKPLFEQITSSITYLRNSSNSNILTTTYFSKIARLDQLKQHYIDNFLNTKNTQSYLSLLHNYLKVFYDSYCVIAVKLVYLEQDIAHLITLKTDLASTLAVENFIHKLYQNLLYTYTRKTHVDKTKKYSFMLSLWYYFQFKYQKAVYTSMYYMATNTSILKKGVLLLHKLHFITIVDEEYYEEAILKIYEKLDRIKETFHLFSATKEELMLMANIVYCERFFSLKHILLYVNYIIYKINVDTKATGIYWDIRGSYGFIDTLKYNVKIGWHTMVYIVTKIVPKAVWNLSKLLFTVVGNIIKPICTIIIGFINLLLRILTKIIPETVIKGLLFIEGIIINIIINQIILTAIPLMVTQVITDIMNIIKNDLYKRPLHRFKMKFICMPELTKKYIKQYIKKKAKHRIIANKIITLINKILKRINIAILSRDYFWLYDWHSRRGCWRWIESMFIKKTSFIKMQHYTLTEGKKSTKLLFWLLFMSWLLFNFSVPFAYGNYLRFDYNFFYLASIDPFNFQNVYHIYDFIGIKEPEKVWHALNTHFDKFVEAIFFFIQYSELCLRDLHDSSAFASSWGTQTSFWYTNGDFLEGFYRDYVIEIFADYPPFNYTVYQLFYPQLLSILDLEIDLYHPEYIHISLEELDKIINEKKPWIIQFKRAVYNHIEKHSFSNYDVINDTF